MTKYQWPESLLLMQELIMFFQVKDVNFEQDDIIINEAGESVPTHFSLPNIRRTKINIEDFNEIYEREFQKKQIEDTPEKRHLFREELVNHVQSKIGIYKLSIKDMNQNTDLVDIANNFIEFIGNMDKPETKVCPTELKEQGTDEEFNIDGILKDMFKGGINAEQLGVLKNNLRGESKYVRLVYIGTKANLWKDTVNLRQANIERKDIARVFSECVKWKKSHSSSINKDLKYDELYSKILNKK